MFVCTLNVWAKRFREGEGPSGRRWRIITHVHVLANSSREPEVTMIPQCPQYAVPTNLNKSFLSSVFCFTLQPPVQSFCQMTQTALIPLLP